MVNDSVKVKIFTAGTVPIFGRGPKLQPVTMSRAHYELLLKQGVKMEIVGDADLKPMKVPQPKKPEESKKPVPAAAPEEPKKLEEPAKAKPEPVPEEPVVETAPKEPAAEESKEKKGGKKHEEETVEAIINDENLSAGAVYTADFLTKKKCLRILAARGIEPDPSHDSSLLKEQVLSSNPEVVEP